jgi:3-oxoadipate enol-lactonase
VALVHGLGLPGIMWLGLPEELAHQGYSVVTPDARGTGRSDVPRPPYSTAMLAADLARVIEDVKQGPALVVALSMGGMVAQQLALRHPDQVRGLVLGATTCGWPRGRLPPPLFPLQVLWSLVDPDGTLPRIRRLMVGPGRYDEDPSIFDEWDREQRSAPMPWQGVVGHLSAAATHSTGLALRRLRCPTTVVVGESDQLLPPENSHILARLIPDAELVALPDAGHAFPLERPEVLPQLIHELQRRVETAPSPQRRP